MNCPTCGSATPSTCGCPGPEWPRLCVRCDDELPEHRLRFCIECENCDDIDQVDSDSLQDLGIELGSYQS